MKEHKKYLSIFAVLLLAVFAIVCVFGVACKGNKEEDEPEPSPEITVEHTHSYEASWDWGTDNTTCDVTLTCTSTEGECDTPTVKDTIKTTSEETTKATCEGEGVITYTATYEYEGKTYSDTRDETVDALGHTWPATDDEVNVDWDWTGRTEDAVTLTVTCPVCGKAIVHEDVEYDADENDETLLVASYTATIEGESGYTYESTYNTESDEGAEHHHHYGEPTWSWTATDDGYSATATFTCKAIVGTAEDADEEEIEVEAEVAYEITTTATCATDGVITYTATVEFGGAEYTDTKEDTIQQTEHDWDTENPSWEWTKDSEGKLSATLTFVCKNDASHEWSETDSNVTDNGDGSYTATVIGPDGTTPFEGKYTPPVELDIPVHIDFNDPSTYDFISFKDEIKNNTEVVVGTNTSYTSGIITYVPLDGAKILDVPVSETENIMTLTTKGNTTSSGGYFEIDLAGYIEQTVKITLVMTANTDSDSNGRSMFITTNKTDTAYSESTVLQYGTSYGKNGANPTVIEFIGTITDETSIIYITSYGNNCILSLDVVLADESEIPNVTISLNPTSLTLELDGDNGASGEVVVTVTLKDGTAYSGTPSATCDDTNVTVTVGDVANGSFTVTVTANTAIDNATVTVTVAEGFAASFTLTVSADVIVNEELFEVSAEQTVTLNATTTSTDVEVKVLYNSTNYSDGYFEKYRIYIYSSNEGIAYVTKSIVEGKITVSTAAISGMATITIAIVNSDSPNTTIKSAVINVTVEGVGPEDMTGMASETITFTSAKTLTEEDNTLLQNDYVTVVASSGLSIDSNNKSDPEYTDRTQYGFRLKLSNTGSAFTYNVTMTTQGEAVIRFAFYSSNSSYDNIRSAKFVQIADDGTETILYTTDGIRGFGDLVIWTVYAPEAGTYYMTSTKSGINVYAIDILYPATDGGSDEEPGDESSSDFVVTEKKATAVEYDFSGFSGEIMVQWNETVATDINEKAEAGASTVSFGDDGVLMLIDEGRIASVDGSNDTEFVRTGG